MTNTMTTTLFIDKQIAQFDGQITEQLTLSNGTEKEIKIERMQIGIRNDDGDIYRAIGVTDFGDFMNAINKLVDIGLIDELQHENRARHGYDAIFSAPK